MKKILSILLTVAMLLSMSVTAFAAENTLITDNTSDMQIIEFNGTRIVTYSDATTIYIVTYSSCPALLNLGHHEQIHRAAEQCAANRHIEGQHGIRCEENAAYEGKHKKQCRENSHGHKVLHGQSLFYS